MKATDKQYCKILASTIPVNDKTSQTLQQPSRVNGLLAFSAILGLALTFLSPVQAGYGVYKYNNNSCDKRANNTEKKVDKCVSSDRLQDLMSDLNELAIVTQTALPQPEVSQIIRGRTPGLGGFRAAADFISDKLKDHYTVSEDQMNPFFFEAIIGAPLANIRVYDGSEFQQNSPVSNDYIRRTDFTVPRRVDFGSFNNADIIPIDVILPLNGKPATEGSSGCDLSDYQDESGNPIDVVGKIVLVQNDDACSIATKALNAEYNGASGFILASNITPTEDVSGLLSYEFVPTPNSAPPGAPPDYPLTGSIPQVSVTLPVGQALTDSFLLGTPARASFDNSTSVRLSFMDTAPEDFNLIIESKGGNPNNVILIQAHLDSTPDSAGINDNGSGVSALVEIATVLKKLRPHNKLRFVFYSREETGLEGSLDYVAKTYIDPNTFQQITEFLTIGAVINFDVIGSIGGGRFLVNLNQDYSETVFGNPTPVLIPGFNDNSPYIQKAFAAGSKVMQEHLSQFFADRGLNSLLAPGQEAEDITDPAVAEAFSFYQQAAARRTDTGPWGLGPAFFDPTGTVLPRFNVVDISSGIGEKKESPLASLFPEGDPDVFDICINSPCDTFDNYSPETHLELTRAGASLVITLAQNSEEVNGIKSLPLQAVDLVKEAKQADEIMSKHGNGVKKLTKGLKKINKDINRAKYDRACYQINRLIRQTDGNEPKYYDVDLIKDINESGKTAEINSKIVELRSVYLCDE